MPGATRRAGARALGAARAALARLPSRGLERLVFTPPSFRHGIKFQAALEAPGRPQARRGRTGTGSKAALRGPEGPARVGTASAAIPWGWGEGTMGRVDRDRDCGERSGGRTISQSPEWCGLLTLAGELSPGEGGETAPAGRQERRSAPR